MKIQRSFTAAVLLVLALVLSYSLGYRSGSRSARVLTFPPGVRHVGFAYHEMHRNDVPGLVLEGSRSTNRTMKRSN